MQMSEIALTINGDVRRLELDPRTSLLDALRETLDLTGTKKAATREPVERARFCSTASASFLA